jgi:hypothetical protein
MPGRADARPHRLAAVCSIGFVGVGIVAVLGTLIHAPPTA